MSRRYTLEECYTMLDVHPKTFRQWLKDDNITTKASKADKRIKFLTEEQVKQLAESHDKPWPPTTPQEVEVIPVTAYKLLIEQVEQINAAQATLQAGIAELRGQQENAILQFTAIGAAQQEQVQREQREQESHWKRNYNAMHEVHNKLVEGIADQVKQQGESLAQLGTRIDELQHIQKEMQTRLQEQQAQAEQRLQAQLQGDLATLRKLLHEEFERQAQGTEQGLTRDVAALTTQVEQQSQEGSEQLTAHATSVAEEAKIAALASQGQITDGEQDVTNHQQDNQAEKAARVDLAEHITQPETQTQGEPQRTTPEKPAPTRRKTSTRKVAEVEPTAT